MTDKGAIPEPFFVAYFDEAGDPGVKKVAPIDKNGASEWFTLACVVVRATNEPKVVDLVRDIKAAVNSRQSPDLHFRNLLEDRKHTACSLLAKYDLRAFVVVSNKKNMRGYRNPAAEAVSLHPNDWFYNYCVRILLERVSDWCARKSLRETGAKKHVKLVFSKRGGHSYRHVNTYTHLLSIQAAEGRLYQDIRAPDFDVIDHRLIEVLPHQKSAGCQIADVVASSFFQAAHTGSSKWTTRHAEALKPRMASKGSGVYAGVGVTLLPWASWTLKLTNDQKKIFQFFGYRI